MTAQAPINIETSLKELSQIRFALDASAIVAITDVKGRIIFVNDTFCAISKYKREELLGQDHRILNSKYHPKEFFRELWRSIAQGKVWKGEIRNRAKDGSFYWVDTTIIPFLDKEGKPYQYWAIRYEITSRKLMEEQIERFSKRILSKRSPSMDVLTKREKEILGLVAKGLANKNIATKLQISIRTAETHRNRMMHKLAIKTPAGLVKYAIAKGLM
jgi:PAS domain S-box-containing protein